MCSIYYAINLNISDPVLVPVCQPKVVLTPALALAAKKQSEIASRFLLHSSRICTTFITHIFMTFKQVLLILKLVFLLQQSADGGAGRFSILNPGGKLLQSHRSHCWIKSCGCCEKFHGLANHNLHMIDSQQCNGFESEWVNAYLTAQY